MSDQFAERTFVVRYYYLITSSHGVFMIMIGVAYTSRIIVGKQSVGFRHSWTEIR